MAMMTFDDVLNSINRNNRGKARRKFHLILGNGFSMAYDPKIFSYNALHDFITKLDDDDLSTILAVVKTKNFELIMQQLDSISALLDALNADATLKARVAVASAKLKKGLIDAVKSLHPEHVFKVPEEQSAACSQFLDIFLKTEGSVFSTNYDLLLYWILLRNNIERHNDGFGRELENPEEVARGEDQVWSSELIWGKYRAEQNVFYLHGTLPFFDTGIDIIKAVYDGANFLLENVGERMDAGEYPVFVTAGDGRQKLSHIMHNKYLTWCYDKLCSIDGSLVSLGFNFGPYDHHIIDAINRAARQPPANKLHSIYIGAYSDADKRHIDSIRGHFACKVNVFDAQTVDIWGKA